LEELSDSKVSPEGKKKIHKNCTDSSSGHKRLGFESIPDADQIMEQLNFSFQYAFQRSASDKRVRAACTSAQIPIR
jgi:hypothetical protein